MSMRYSTSLLGFCLAIATGALLSPIAAQQWVMPRTPDGKQFHRRQINREGQTTRRENRGECAWPTCFHAVACQHEAENQHRQIPRRTQAWYRQA